MRHEKLYLTDIVEAARAIEKFIMGEDFNEFEQNEMMNSAVLQKLAVIGEAASKLPKEFTKRFPEIPWRDIIGFRAIASMNILLSAGILFGSPRQRKPQPCVNRLNRFCMTNLLMNEKGKSNRENNNALKRALLFKPCEFSIPKSVCPFRSVSPLWSPFTQPLQRIPSA